MELSGNNSQQQVSSYFLFFVTKSSILDPAYFNCIGSTEYCNMIHKNSKRCWAGTSHDGMQPRENMKNSLSYTP